MRNPKVVTDDPRNTHAAIWHRTPILTPIHAAAAAQMGAGWWWRSLKANVHARTANKAAADRSRAIKSPPADKETARRLSWIGAPSSPEAGVPPIGETTGFREQQAINPSA
jgi:hypothetical protein